MLIGVDVGTTNIKAVVMNESGQVCAFSEKRNDLICPEAGYSEQDPEALFQNVLSVLQQVIQTKNIPAIRGGVFSAAMHGFMAVDVEGNPLTNIWLWSDLRAKDVARSLLRDGGAGMQLYHNTGVPIHPMSPLCKLIWLREHLPDVFRKAHKFLGIKEYIWYRLTGKYESDISCASASGFMNIHTNEWEKEALEIAGISVDKLPGLVSTRHQAQLSGSFSLPESLSYRTPTLIIGASDGAFANLGSGATGPGQVAITIGTSAAIRSLSSTPATDDAMRSFCYRLDENRCIIGGASNNGTNVLEWLRSSVFASEHSTERFLLQAVNIQPGAEGLHFLPYIHGERAPLWDAQATGAFYGLTTQHGQAHFVRAAMEGVLYNLKLIAEGINIQVQIDSLHAGGGFSQNHLWVQMLADIFQRPVLIRDGGVDASVFGAIQLGRSVLGLKPLIQTTRDKVFQPNTADRAVYENAYRQFRKGISV